MFIIPYYIEEPKETAHKSDCKVWKAWVFLSKGGTQVWETDEACSVKEVVDSYLTPNGFVGEVSHKTKTCVYFRIQKDKTNLSDLYTWKEFLEKDQDIPDVPVLRPFIWVGDAIGVKDDWGWSEQCAEVSLGKYGTLLNLWTALSAFSALSTVSALSALSAFSAASLPTRI